MELGEGAAILLIDQRGKKYLTYLKEGGELHTDLGVVKHNDMIGEKFGDTVRSHLGREFCILRPRIPDLIEKMTRVSTLVLPKDAAYIIMHTGLGSGDRVVDAGVGSGGLAIMLGHIVKPKGEVVTYEVRKKFAEIAQKNIELAKLENVVKIKLKDITEGIDEKGLDLVTLDISMPWKAVPHTQNALKPGGFVAVYTPYIEQAKKTQNVLKKHGFTNRKLMECLIREYEVSNRGMRPKTWIMGHTGYLNFGRKI